MDIYLISAYANNVREFKRLSYFKIENWANKSQCGYFYNIENKNM